MLREPNTPGGPATRRTAVALAGLTGLVGLVVLVATASGLGVSPDGVAYLSLADEFRNDGSAYAVLAPSATHYAPLWAVLVGGFSAVTGIDDLLGIGRFFNAILAAAIAPLVYLAVRRSAAAPAWWGVLAAAVAVLLFGLFRLSVRALTEPLFVVLLLITLLLVEAGIRNRSRRLLVGAAAVAAAVVLTRFAGVALVLPLAIAAWRLTPGGLRRVVDVAVVALVTIAPTALWALAAPSTTTSTHLGSGGRGGLDDLVQSFVEAGHVLIDPPSAAFADPLYFLLGAVVLVAPFVGAAAVVRRRSLRNDVDVELDGHGARSRIDVDMAGLLPWLLFLVGYGALIVAQRWWIDREVIDRYWVPFIVVGIVIVARAIAEVGVLDDRRWRTVAVASAGTIVLINLVLVVAFTATRADRGIELNETRYQQAELFDQAALADVDLVLTDSVRLVELHLVALGDADVDVRDIGCRWSGESNALTMAEAATVPTAVILAGLCDREANTADLATIEDSVIVTETDVGTLVLVGGP